MTASKPDIFPQPTDECASVWRYMDVSKFLALVLNDDLYIPRSDFLGDPFEGSVSANSRANLVTKVKDQFDHITAQEEGSTVHQKLAEDSRLLDKVVRSSLHAHKVLTGHCYISCWHMNEHESAAMWKLYSSSHDAIAIRTTYHRLAEMFDERANIGLVKYIDYDHEGWPPFNMLQPFIHKRMSFSHENEVRIVKFHSAPEKPKEFPHGINQSFPFNDIVDGVYVSPTSSSWLADVIKKTLELRSITTPVYRSKLAGGPIF